MKEIEYIFLGKIDTFKIINKRLKTSVNYAFYDVENLHKNVFRTIEKKILSDNVVVFFLNKVECFYKIKSLATKCYDVSDFVYTNFYNPIGTSSSTDITTLIMGMSHSQCGIDEFIVGESKIQKMSAPSLDLYLQYEFIRKAVKCNSINCTKLRKIVIEMPYYYFNYDLSKFRDFLPTKLYYYKLINDYSKTGLQEDMLTGFDLFSELFKHETIPESNNKIIDERKVIKKIYSSTFKPMFNKDKVWSHKYEKTIEENTIIFSRLIDFLHKKFINAEIIVLVMPMNPCFYKTHFKQVSDSRIIFYDIIDNLHLKVIDNFYLFNSPFMFIDHCHLNAKGCDEYSKYLKSELERDFR